MPMSYDFVDNFHRINSAAVGNGWHQIKTGDWGSGGPQIFGNKLRFLKSGPWEEKYASIYRSYDMDNGTIEVNLRQHYEGCSDMYIFMGNEYDCFDPNFRGYVLHWSTLNKMSLLVFSGNDTPYRLVSMPVAYTLKNENLDDGMSISFGKNGQNFNVLINGKLIMSANSARYNDMSCAGLGMRPGVSWYYIADFNYIALSNTGFVQPTFVSSTAYFQNQDLFEIGPRQYNLVYDANGGHGYIPPVRGIVVTLASGGFTRDVKERILEWNTQADGAGHSYALGEVITLTSNLKLYAIWGPLRVQNHYSLGRQVNDRMSYNRPVQKTYCKGKLVWER